MPCALVSQWQGAHPLRAQGLFHLPESALASRTNAWVEPRSQVSLFMKAG